MVKLRLLVSKGDGIKSANINEIRDGTLQRFLGSSLFCVNGHTERYGAQLGVEYHEEGIAFQDYEAINGKVMDQEQEIDAIPVDPKYFDRFNKALLIELEKPLEVTV